MFWYEKFVKNTYGFRTQGTVKKVFLAVWLHTNETTDLHGFNLQIISGGKNGGGVSMRIARKID